MGFFGENGVGHKFLTRENFYDTLKITAFCKVIILVVFVTFLLP